MPRMYYEEQYLEHHGVLGQKWGVRRYQKANGTLTSAGKKRYLTEGGDVRKKVDQSKADYKTATREFSKAWNKAYNSIGPHITKRGRDAELNRWNDAYDKMQNMESAKQAYRSAKSELKTYNKNKKQEERDNYRKNAKNYHKKYDEYDKMQDQADAEWRKVKEQYKSLGKTPVQRILNAAKGQSEAAKEYLKSYDKAEMLSNKADAKFAEAKKSYINSGKNAVQRVFNTFTTDPIIRDRSKDNVDIRKSETQKMRERIAEQDKIGSAPTLKELRNKKSGNF